MLLRRVRQAPDMSQASAGGRFSYGQAAFVTRSRMATVASCVSVSQHGTAHRLGRQYVNGAYSARDPASLPVCAR